MTTRSELLTRVFRALSARLGQDPSRIQGPGGNTSIKDDQVMWIKASGTQLADAEEADIFVPVDLAAARAEAQGEGDGSCKDTVLDPNNPLRPSIETTFHAALPNAVVAHIHSVATIAHAISEDGIAALEEKLAGLPFKVVGYAKPGLPLTKLILDEVETDTRVIVLRNHGLICCGETVEEVSSLVDEVEDRLALPSPSTTSAVPDADPAPGYEWAPESWLAQDEEVCEIVLAGTYYPDHIVFLGSALPQSTDTDRPAVLIPGQGVLLKTDATDVQKQMLRCLSDVFAMMPKEWRPIPIGLDAEAALLNWDAEKYRQGLAANS